MFLLEKSAYARSGVDLRKVRGLQRTLARVLGGTFTNRSGKTGAPLIPIGHYAGLVDLGRGHALALHTDGVGSKVLVAQMMGRFDTIGIDCVAMTVNDLVCIGAEPVALLDYIALQREDERLVTELSRGLAEGARRASAAIVGGETAILGDVVKGVRGRGFDLVSMGAGFVDKDLVVDGSRLRPGDVVLGVESSGLHSNGYTLARKVLRRLPLSERPVGLNSTLGDELLMPTRIYVRPVLSALRDLEVHAVGHITGGSFAKLARLTGRRKLMFDLRLPPPPPIFRLIQARGKLQDSEMYRTFNMGIGLCLALPESESARAARIFRRAGFGTHELGRVREGGGVAVNGVKV